MAAAASPPEAEARTHAPPRDPDVYLEAVAWVVVALSALQVIMLPFGRDQGIYAVVGGGLAHGQVPYRDLWDFKPPGIYAVYALAETLFGHRMVGVRVIEVLGLLGMVLAMRAVSRELVGRALPGLLGGALASLIHAELEFWHTGQPESFAGFLTVIALWLTVRARDVTAWGGRAGAAAIVGVCFGLAFLLKPPHGGGAIVCAAYLVQAELRRGAPTGRAALHWLFVGGSSFLPILATVGWFAAVGGLESLRWTFLEFVPGYTALSPNVSAFSAYYYAFQETFVGFSAIAPVGVLAAVALPPLHSREREGAWLFFGVICLQVAGIAMQGKFFQYHYAATLPLVAFIAGVGLYKGWRRAVRVRFVGAIGFAVALALLASMRTAVRSNPGTFWERTARRMVSLVYGGHDRVEAALYFVADYSLAADREVAAYVASVTEPGDAIYVWGFEPAIYWLAERAPASPYIYDVPQRATWNREQARDALMRQLDARPPAAVVVQHDDRFDWVTGDTLDSAAALGTFPRLSAKLAGEYQLTKMIEDFDVYLRRD